MKIKNNVILKFWLFQSVYLVFANSIMALWGIVIEVTNFGIKNVALYVGIPVLIIVSYIWIIIYFCIMDDEFKSGIKINIDSDNRYKEMKLLEKKANGYPYLLMGACVLYNMLMSGFYTIFMIIENGRRWWIIGIGILELLVLSAISLITIVVVLGTNQTKKKMINKIKHYEESNNETRESEKE